MIKKIKLLFSLMLVACLALPLSTCKREPIPLEGSEKYEATIVDHYVVNQSGNLLYDYLPALFFLLPLLLVWVTWNEKRFKFRFRFIELVDSVVVIGLVYMHTYLGKLVLGGYLAMTAAVGLLLLVIVELFQQRGAKASKQVSE